MEHYTQLGNPLVTIHVVIKTSPWNNYNYFRTSTRHTKDHIVSYSGELCSLADPQAGLDYCSSAAGLLTVGRSCVVTRPKDRPDMKVVLNDVDILYTNYKDAERVTSLVRQCSPTLINPLQLQVMHDERRNRTLQGSPQPISIPFPFPNQAQFLSPEDQRFAQVV
ncbi:hypothetical protein J6590_023315 [Homalodisca vitripennis]|nr:hypothetical protein J6590_023315 [Homalodisca vitripennis]